MGVGWVGRGALFQEELNRGIRGLVTDRVPLVPEACTTLTVDHFGRNLTTLNTAELSI